MRHEDRSGKDAASGRGTKRQAKDGLGILAGVRAHRSDGWREARQGNDLQASGSVGSSSKMNSTATYSKQHRSSTCPNTAAFYPYPVNVSNAWTYPAPSVHFLAEFGHVGFPPDRCGVGNLGISSLVFQLISLDLRIGKDILTCKAEQGWGAKIIESLTRALRAAFLKTMGVSRSNVTLTARASANEPYQHRAKPKPI